MGTVSNCIIGNRAAGHIEGTAAADFIGFGIDDDITITIYGINSFTVSKTDFAVVYSAAESKGDTLLDLNFAAGINGKIIDHKCVAYRRISSGKNQGRTIHNTECRDGIVDDIIVTVFQ